MDDLESLILHEIDLTDPTPELSEYINRNQNLILYYASKFLTDDLSADPEYQQLSPLDYNIILAIACASLDLDTHEILNRPR